MYVSLFPISIVQCVNLCIGQARERTLYLHKGLANEKKV